MARITVEQREVVWRVVALVAGVAALVLVRSLTRGWPWWLAGAAAIVAFLVAARTVNALRPALPGAKGRRR